MTFRYIVSIFAFSQKTYQNSHKIYITMNKINSKNWEGLLYAAPSVNVLDVRAEGVLCASYGDPNAPGKDLGQENEWDL